MGIVLVVVESTADVPSKATLELLTLARRIGEPHALIFGSESSAVAPRLAEYGATTVFTVTDPIVDEYLVVPKVDAAAAAIERLGGPGALTAVLIGSSPESKEIAGRLAVRIGAGLLTDALDVRPGDGGDGVAATQSAFAANFIVESAVDGRLALVGV